VATKLVLASASPRRHALLASAGFKFEIAGATVTERFDRNLTLCELTLYNASRKGLFVARSHRRQVVLAADTLVAIDDDIIGKPSDMNEAATILRRLSGRAHLVCTAVFICQLSEARISSFCETSAVQFKSLTSKTIRAYVAKVNPLDKAGAYAAQGAGSEIIEAIDGSFTNVVGLPMEPTTAELRRFGIEPTSVN
jgi:nucleoside triphosphate pyrophosphatase